MFPGGILSRRPCLIALLPLVPLAAMGTSCFVRVLGHWLSFGMGKPWTLIHPVQFCFQIAQLHSPNWASFTKLLKMPLPVFGAMHDGGRAIFAVALPSSSSVSLMLRF